MQRLPCHDEPGKFHFSARLLSTREEKGLYYTVLDRTWFYPESGGQPADRGMLNDTPVLDVQIQDDKIVHVTESPVGQGDDVWGVIDSARRIDHMQQHTGQHLLSALLLRDWGVPTVGFHISEEVTTIDLPRDAFTPREIEHLEEQANALIGEHHPVTSFWIDVEDLHRYKIRKEGKMEKEVRLVNIEGVDLSMCAGTHVDNTSELMLFKITGQEKIRGGQVRLSFLFGHRALRHFQRISLYMEEIRRALSLPEKECPDGVRRLLEEKAFWSREKKKTDSFLIELLSDRLAEENGYVAASLDWGDEAFLCTLGRRLLDKKMKVVALFHPALGFFCLLSDGSHPVRGWGEILLQRFGGKGGGNETLFRINNCPQDLDPELLLKEMMGR
ncbi:MAG TPA: alanyl-tRNA editing protein [Candidatus Mcinerneyibacteriales bacterium]|jgi:alanyl-tRNA synthetase|nr:alanyl-tRNA editing protein [Candidatus Mcinerneyibacteriales bacterium]HPE20089.1 alanyl-tRNA editing protein [Candidatus Mcinerneyibacteriales bacterium]HPJ70890.1 alanyl-tRNA editing protein [Candidatus Mcinerneyibacteriales bacterium]HPQ88961.1 alanyl-tRNA editing protein [Candidatus Mcinerneyibacteriales bacterium]